MDTRELAFFLIDIFAVLHVPSPPSGKDFAVRAETAEQNIDVYSIQCVDYEHPPQSQYCYKSKQKL
jgi:hypothetical protein